MKKISAMGITAAMCLALLGACGSNTGTASQTGSGESTSVEESTQVQEDTQAAESASGQTVWTIGTNAEFPPFEYVGDNGEPDGFDIALIKAIGDKLGMEVVVENMEFASLVSSIGTKIDAAIAGMTVTEEREQVVDFSQPYYEAVQYVIVAAGSDIATADDLAGKTIGVQLGTTGGYLAEEIEGATAQQYNKAVDAVNDLINGRVDLVIIDKNPALVFEEKFAGQVVALEGAQFNFESEQYAIAMPEGSDMVEKVNKALEELKADGTFDALVAEYIGATE